jgi:hypothetical protein
MSSTFTAPIRVNTRQITSNDGTISPDNTGAAVLSQEQTVTTTTDATIYLPAGSFIQQVVFVATDTGTARDITLDGVSIGNVPTTGVWNYGNLTSVAIANTGPATSVLVVPHGTDGSAGVVSVMYTARNADGTITPYGSGYTNN